MRDVDTDPALTRRAGVPRTTCRTYSTRGYTSYSILLSRRAHCEYVSSLDHLRSSYSSVATHRTATGSASCAGRGLGKRKRSHQSAASSPFTFASFTGHDEIHSPRKQIRSSIQPMASLRPNPTGHPLLFRAPRMLQRLVHCMLHCMLHCIMAVGIEASVGYLALHACHGSRYASQRESGAPCAARSTSLLFTGRRRRRQAAMPPP